MRTEICNDRADCTGCAACCNICPQECIQMKPDKDGFLYPVINRDKCTECNACVNSCPVKTTQCYLPIKVKDRICEKAKDLLHKWEILYHLLRLRS